MAIFVPGLRRYTVAPTCDFCIYVMSLISRPLASLPLPFSFRDRHGLVPKKRVGIGKSIDNHVSFHMVMQREPLRIPPRAEYFQSLKLTSPLRIFVIDFETVYRPTPNLPQYLLEVTARDGNGKIIVSCIINKTGVTNTMFADELRRAGYTNPDELGVRRHRGPTENKLPHNAKTPKEIVDILIAAGLDPSALWIEYSRGYFDRQCMTLLIKNAGMSPESILPPRHKCWTVLQDFMLCLPGLASYKLGRIAKLMHPENPDLQRLHYSDADTAVLLDVLNLWVFKYGRLETP
ncbi:hypothetical protein PV08_06541 [Exophiala spinifera]|uniref:Exonuclease domain-containing protein n=1 Tax=Exophiala spinifera TaxID=91928 RepID=A0A0D1YN58_9EURO|nr:uncharacterized protein PV08_06541 [Exophiala spinifera]KIW16486.1 hypothetical protein PV08_06541 [Exophiala spinifera]